MLNEKILEFYREFQDEVLNYVKENSPISTNIAFKTLFLSYLTEAGETLVSDCALVDFKKDGENMKLDGYAFSEYFHSLTLLVSKYQAKPQPEKIKKTEIDKLSRKVLKFYKTCALMPLKPWKNPAMVIKRMSLSKRIRMKSKRLI